MNTSKVAISWLFLSFAFCLFLPCNSDAQGCYISYTPNYGVYQSASYDGSKLHTSVLTDGTASMTVVNLNPGCPQTVIANLQNSIDNATHTPWAYNKIASVGGWGSGTGSCAWCYISYQNNQSIVATPGQDLEVDSGGEVDCSVGGTISSVGITLHTYSIRLSAYIFNGLSNGRCTWVPSCAGKCSSQHTTNTFNGACFTTGPYKQCFDLLRDGQCWDYRTFCYGKSAPGICTN